MPAPPSPSSAGLAPQDLVLTMCGTYVRAPGATVWAGGMVALLGRLGVTDASARAALARLVNRDLLTRTREGRHALYSLTPRAEALLAEGDRRIFGFGRTPAPPERWTVVWHAIPESRRVERSRLSSRLRFLGFGAVQDATWVAPHDRAEEVRALIGALDIEPHAVVIVGEMAAVLPPRALVAQAWRIEEARGRYRGFLSAYARDAAESRPTPSGAEAFRRRTLMIHAFRDFPSIDPELPPDLDGLGEERARAVATLDAADARLREPATEFFWATAGSPGAPTTAQPALS